MRRLITMVAVATLALGLLAAPAAAKPTGDSIVDIASTNENFEYLTAAVVGTGLAPVLDGNRQFTVFAPVDEAFEAALAALGFGGITPAQFQAALEADADLRAYVTDVLLIHVAPGERFSGDVLSEDKVRTIGKTFLGVDGITLSAELSSADILVGAGLFDIEARNGVIHVIDTVLLDYLP